MDGPEGRPDAVPVEGGEDSQRGLARLLRAIQDLSGCRTVEAVRDVVRHAARELVGADGATFVLRDGDQCHYVDEDAISPLWKGMRFPMRICISGWAMEHRAAAVVPDIYADPRIPADAYRPTFVRSLVMVPIRQEAPLGAIGNYWSSLHAATPGEVELLQALADTTAVAMENVQVYQELESRVRDRTRDLEAANRELDAFAYSVSHDLRAPLRHVGGFLTLLEEHAGAALDEEGRGYLAIVRSAADRMGQLIDDLLAFSRLGRRELVAVGLDLGALVAGVVEDLKPDTAGREVEWRVGPLPPLRGDPALVRAAFQNLLGNAVKFTARTPRTVIEVAEVPAGPGERAVMVRDNGAGFDPAQADRLFRVFQRLHRDEDFEGTGIGLANVLRIVQRHGGRVWAEGKPGEGAAFFMAFPAPTARSI